MKRPYKIILIIGIFFAVTLCSQVLDHSLNVMTFNIRYDNPDDGPNAWPRRKDLVASVIRFHEADIVGVQEALAHQLDELSELFPNFKWIGAGRDDGKTAGEYSPIFFRTDRLELLESNTFWLSATPDSVSRGWDAACHRVVTWGRFQDILNGQDLYVFNTHFDHLGQVARKESSLLVRKKVMEISGGKPFILTGDFNAEPDSEPIRLLVESPDIQDSRIQSRQPHHGPTYTFTGFDPNPRAEGDPIDYIFISPQFQVIRHTTISDHFNGRLPSDHYPVFAEIR